MADSETPGSNSKWLWLLVIIILGLLLFFFVISPSGDRDGDVDDPIAATDDLGGDAADSAFDGEAGGEDLLEDDSAADGDEVDVELPEVPVE